MRHYDVVIIGGGPAGSSLAFLLKKQGVSCCIVEKAVFPRDKLCGGLLTEKTVSTINRIYGDIGFPHERISKTVSLFCENKKLSTVTTQSVFYLVERKAFDDYLLMQFKNNAGEVFEGESIHNIAQSEHIVELQSGLSIQYSVLVGADGANSYVRRLIAPQYRPNAICVETSITSNSISDEICVFFTDGPSGYGWCFPKSDYFTVGMGGDVKYNRDIRDTFSQFAEMIGKPISKHSIRGAMVPFGKYVKRPFCEDVLLVGDAAGLVDPITGEGLYFALRSSEIASKAIIERLRAKTSFDRTYAKDTQNN